MSFLSSRDLLMIATGMCVAVIGSGGFTVLRVFDADVDQRPWNKSFEAPPNLRRSSCLTAPPERDGWRSVHLYYGSADLLTNAIKVRRLGYPGSQAVAWGSDEEKFDDASVRWYSEHGQDVAVAKFFGFKRSGYFIDLAAHKAAESSNTYALERYYGWEGLCIEPNSVYWFDLSMRRKCHVLGAVVGPKSMQEVTFRVKDNAPGLAGIVGDDFDNKPRTQDEVGNDSTRYTASFSDILEMFDVPRVIDFLSLDVEGAERFIMGGFPFERYTINVMTVERPDTSLVDLLQDHGYKHVYNFRRGDTLWAHSSVYDDGKSRVEKDKSDITLHQVKNLPPLAFTK